MRLMDSKHDVVVPKGTTAIYDASLGPLKIDGRLVNHGTIRLRSSQKDVSESAIIASELESDGAIISDLPKLTIAAANIDAHGGKISASDRIVLNSKNDLQVRGGTFDSQWVDFITPGKLQVRADRIRGQVSIEADSIAFGVTSGNLTVASSKVSGDPLYYNSGGDVSIPTTSTGGEDLYLFATGNVTVTGPVDTSGGPNDSNHLGRFFAIAGLPSVGPPPPIDQQTPVVCQNCDSEMAMLGVTSFAGTGTVNVMGGITSKGVAHLGGGVITVGGNVVTSASGGFAISFLNSATVNGTITAGSGGVSFVTTDFTVYSQNQTVTVTGQIVSPGAIAIITAGSGSIQLADIHAGLGGAINISAGSPMVPTCETPSPQKVSVGLATITTGNLTASYFITLAASGNISTGAADLVQNGSPLPGPGSHYMQINANVANTSAPVFQVGAGGTNGTGTITNFGRHNPFGDALVITNPGGISVTTADINLMHNIGLDATSGLITLDAGLSVNGTSLFRAGSIAMQGGKLIVPAIASLTANDTTAHSTDPAPSIMLAFSEIPLSGNLHVTTNSDLPLTSVQIYTAGNLIIDIGGVCTVNPPVSGPVLFSGSGKAEITANSKSGSVQIIGTPLTFAAGTIGVTSMGDNTNSIQLNWDGVVRNNNSFVSTGGKVTLDADGAAGNATASAGLISIQADGINVTSPFAAHANAIATSSGNGGTIGITAASGTLTAGTSNFALNANSLGSGNGGTLNLTAPTMTMNGANLKVTAGPTGNGTGGTISGTATTTTGDLTITGTLSANGAGTGNGGTISLTAGTAGLLTTGTLSANGQGSGKGGNISLAGQGIHTTGSISADGGAFGGAGGNVSLNYASISSLAMATLSAASFTTGMGGTISIMDNGPVIMVVGTLRTSTVAQPSASRGTTTISTTSDTSENISLTAQMMNTNLVMDGNVVSATASAASNFGLGNCTGQTSLSVSATATGSTLEVLSGTTVVANGTAGVNLAVPSITLDTNSSVSTAGTSGIGITTNALTFQSGATISASTGGVGITSPSGATSPMVITVPSGSTVQGVTSSNSLIVSSPNGVTFSGSGGELQFVSSGDTTATAIEASNGAIVDNGVTLVSTNPLRLGLTGFGGIGSSSSPLLTFGVTELQSTGGSTYVTESGTQAFTLDQSSSTGAFNLSAAGSITATSGLRVDSSSPLSIVAGQSLTFGNSNIAASTITLVAGSGALVVQNGASLTSNKGAILISNTNTSGTISLGSGAYASIGSESAGTPGLIQVAVGTVDVTNLDPLNRPSKVEVNETAFGQIYWGPAPGVTVSTASTVGASGNSNTGLAQVIFSSPSGQSAITMNGSAVTALTLP